MSVPAVICNLFHADRAWRKEVVVKFVGNILDDLLGLHTISRLVQARSEYRNRTFARNDCDDSAADSAFGWKTYMPGPSTRTVVKSGHSHGGEDERHVFDFDNLFSGRRILTVIGEHRAHAGKLSRVHADRALFCIDIDGFKRIGVNALVFGE